MAVMPHKNADRALETALSLDIPFWPQLPLLNYYEDMYVQAAEHFPGILLDVEKRTLRFSTEKFALELDRGGVLVWGLVPSNFEPFGKESLDALETRLVRLWDTLAAKGIDREFLLSRSLLSPATCCLVNPDREITVEKAFHTVKALSRRLRERYALI